MGDVIPSAEAASADTDDGIELAGFSVDTLGSRDPTRASTDRRALEIRDEAIQVEADTYRCESSIVHVQTLEFAGSGERIILRIDTNEGRAAGRARRRRRARTARGRARGLQDRLISYRRAWRLLLVYLASRAMPDVFPSSTITLARPTKAG